MLFIQERLTHVFIGLKAAGLQRVSRLVSIAKQTVRQAQADWPPVLKNAPHSVKKAVTERLAGGVALTGKN